MKIQTKHCSCTIELQESDGDWEYNLRDELPQECSRVSYGCKGFASKDDATKTALKVVLQDCAWLIKNHNPLSVTPLMLDDIRDFATAVQAEIDELSQLKLF